MKSIAIFFLFLLAGFGIVTGHVYIQQQNPLFNPNSTITTKFSLANAPGESLKGKIATMSGTVIWLSRVAKEPVKLTSLRTIQQGEELTTGKNSKAGILINNSAAVILSANSDVSFVQMLPINLVMSQDKGTIIYQDTGQNALSVQTSGLLTAINRAWAVISVNSKTETVTVTVQKGSVTEGYENSQNNSNVVTLNAGSKFVFDDTKQEGTVE